MIRRKIIFNFLKLGREGLSSREKILINEVSITEIDEDRYLISVYRIEIIELIINILAEFYFSCSIHRSQTIFKKKKKLLLDSLTKCNC